MMHLPESTLDSNGATLSSHRPTPFEAATTTAPAPGALRTANRPQVQHEPRYHSLAVVIERAATRRGLALERAGTHPIPTALELRQVGPAGTPWLVCHADRDPLLASSGSMPVPRQIRATMARLVEEGFDFPVTIVAHQCAPGDQPKASEVLAAPGSAITAQRARSMVKHPGAHPEGRRSVDRIEQGAASVERAVSRVGRAASRVGVTLGSMAAAIALDPIVFGAVAPPGRALHPGEPAAWFVIGRWDW